MKANKVLLAGVAVLGVMSTFAAVRAVTPTAWDWDNNPECWQMKRHNQKMQSVTNGGAQVVFIGDSITHFWENAGQKTWAKYFASGKYKAINLGTSADRTEHVLWRITEGRELDGYKAKAILLMIGTNNTGHFPVEKETPIDTIYGVRKILDVIAEKQPNARTILTAIFPRGADASDPRRMRNDVVNVELAKFADGHKVIWCDFNDKFLSSDGRLSRVLFPDLLHPGPTGYEIWASAVLPLLDRIFAASPDEAIASVWPSNPQYYPFGDSPATTPVSRFGSFVLWDGDCLFGRRDAVADGPGEYDIVMLGDSITHRWEHEGRGAALFAELKKRYRILNLGIGGDRAEHLLWRLLNGDLEGYKAKVFTLMVGTNNVGQNPASIAKSIKLMLDAIRRRHPESKTVLMPIFPRNAAPNDRIRVNNEKVNAIIKDFADGDAVVWLDFNKDFLAEDGTLPKEVMDDFVHPTQSGYRIWWKAMEPVVDKMLGR